MHVTFIALVLFTGYLWQEKGSKPPSSNQMQEGHAPTPFSAEDIRRGCPDGRRDVFRIETAGQPDAYRQVLFRNTTAQGTSFVGRLMDADRNPLGAEQTATATWRQLQGHASFPADRTTIEHDTYTTPAGTFDCWRYTVTSPTSEDSETIQRFWFARSLPGPPVRFEQERNGKIVYAMTLASVTYEGEEKSSDE